MNEETSDDDIAVREEAARNGVRPAALGCALAAAAAVAPPATTASAPSPGPQSGGHAAAHDDALPITRPGTCASRFCGPDQPQRDRPHVGGHEQRLIATHRVTAFFGRCLEDETGRQPYLTGRRSFHGERTGVVNSAYDAGP